MLHWHASSLAGLVMTGRYRPVCAAVALAPDCMAKRAFERAMERAFGEPGHVCRVGATWLIGDALRRGAGHDRG